MNRTDRLFAIVLELQAKKKVRAEDLAAIFEVSKRTIYRDFDALNEAGIPVVAVPGQGYSLVEGYFLPPLSFKTDEAVMLLLGADLMAQNFDEQFREAAQAASRKIISVLPEHLRQEVEYLEQSIQFMVFNEANDLETLRHLREAIVQCRRVRFTYYSRSGGDQPQVREADPYALLQASGAWMLVAYCHLRQDIRHFRLDRMEAVTILSKKFSRPADFKIERSSEADRAIVVRAVFDHEVKRRVVEGPSYYMTAHEEHPEGLLVMFKVRQLQDLLGWLRSWGAHVRVLEPEALREMVREEARRVVENYSI